MKRFITSIGALAVLGAGFSLQLTAQGSSEGPAIEPDAMAALNKMGAYLRTLKSFEVDSTITSEDVLTNGMKVQTSKKTKILAQLPDKLRVQIDGDDGAKFYLFDGKTFTLFARDDGFYATVPAPSTLKELVDNLSDKYGIEVPLVDLFMWGRTDFTPPKITVAMDVGPSSVGDTTCEQYAFRQEGLDWGVWIQLGDHPLPRKLVLTTTTDEARPQHTSVISWNLAPSYNEAAFVFTPPEGAHKIVMAANK
jgi:hypothetical protein